MERKVKSNKGIYVIVYILLLITTGLGVILYFSFDTKMKEKEKENDKETELYNSKQEELNSKKEELEKIINTINDYNDLGGQVSTLKEDYFKSIKALEDAILAGTVDKKIAYLTFDDGPYYNTYKVLDILDKYNVKATFFTTSINGQKCFDNKNADCLVLYKEYLKRGHTIANHTFTHGIFKGLYSSTDSFMDAVIKQEEIIKEQTDGYITNIVRFPGGSRTAGKLKNPIIEKLREKGYGWVDWTAEDGDGKGLESSSQAWSNLKPEIDEKIEVILLHDFNNITTSILPEIIEYALANGYEFKRIDENTTIKHSKIAN